MIMNCKKTHIIAKTALLASLCLSSVSANELSTKAKAILIDRIFNEISLLKQRHNTDVLIHASYAQINCIKKLSDTRYGVRECKKEYKRTLFKERQHLLQQTRIDNYENNL